MFKISFSTCPTSCDVSTMSRHTNILMLESHATLAAISYMAGIVRLIPYPPVSGAEVYRGELN
ncbi:hypothetical protein BC937DRAFT_86554 [Endogone sp. FLAS-F59071]|nr:hypothetical protein BC937DRAFT_86554 [Endogone sp. FLAS-F59071]|eukprot:RUS20017.1 hypothetical protein BC937DRAFT_86554 [Endogone sp. FLAS-F59071]